MTPPDAVHAPSLLRKLPGNCGPISAWMILQLSGKRIGANRIIHACRHTKKVGCYTIALALALREFGLSITFHTDPDPDIQPLEARCYRLAYRLRLSVEPAIELNELSDRVQRQPAIVYFSSAEGRGHFSPLTGYRRGALLLPNSDEGQLSLIEFERRWSAPGYPRQCILVDN